MRIASKPELRQRLGFWTVLKHRNLGNVEVRISMGMA